MSDTLIVGASGLVGRLVIDHAAGPLTIIARREIADLPRQHRLIVAPPERWAEIIAAEKPATLISCLGTTIRQAGSQAAFRAVDRDLVLAVAEAAKRGGATHVISVSSVGAAARVAISIFVPRAKRRTAFARSASIGSTCCARAC